MNVRQNQNNALKVLFDQARNHIAKNELKDAALLLNQAQKHNPNDPRIFVLGGLIAEKSGKQAEAIEAMEHAVLVAPQWWPARLEFALLLARGDKFQPALEQADKVFALVPNEWMALLNLIDIAQRSQDFGRSIRYLEHALSLRPGDALLQTYLARDYARTGQIEQALQTWGQVISAQPDNQQARYGRLHLLVENGRAAEAKDDADALLAQSPEDPIYRYYAQLVQGQTPATQPVELQKNLFDSMAAQYDIHMVRRLGYQLPKLVAEQITEVFPDKKLNLLDLGCGTGLLGVYLGPIQGGMVGVDVSEQMVNQAARHNIYDRFHTVNVLDALRDTQDGLFDVITALDVLPYIGDLATVIPNARRILSDGGFFIFSTEATQKKDDAKGLGYVLQDNGRYAHRRDYLESLLEKSGFSYVKLTEQVIRTERGEPVKGFLVTAQKLG